MIMFFTALFGVAFIASAVGAAVYVFAGSAVLTASAAIAEETKVDVNAPVIEVAKNLFIYL